MTSRWAGALVLVTGLALLAIWQVLPISTPPLYDGIGLPPEPYRYLHPTHAQAANNLPPTSAYRAFILRSNTPTVIVGTKEQGPQAEILLDGSSIRSGSRQTRVRVTIRAVTPPSLPPGMHLDGNVYAITITADGRTAHLRASHAVILLRATSAFLHPSMEAYRAGRWRRLIAAPGYIRESWGAQMAAPGDFALFTQGGPAQPPGTNWAPLIVAGLIALAVAAAGLTLLRLTRRDAPGKTAQK